MRITKVHAHKYYVLENHMLEKPNASGVTKIRRILAEFLGPDAEKNANLFMKAKEEDNAQSTVGSSS